MAIPFLGWVGPLLNAIGLGEKIVVNEQEAVRDQKQKQAGRNEQVVSDQDQAIKRAGEQNRREEDFDRTSGDALDERVRKSME